MKKSLIVMILLSVSSACAKLEYNWKNHSFYHTGPSTTINQDEYNGCVNEVLSEILLSRDFAMAKSQEELELLWLIAYGILRLYGTPESKCASQDIQSIALNKRLTAKLISQLKDSRKH